MQVDVVVIGAGPIGLFSVFQAGMLGMRSCIIDVFDKVGGQCSVLYPEKFIYDIPAHPAIYAQDLVEKLTEQAKAFDPIYQLSQQVNSLKKLDDNLFEVGTTTGNIITAKVVIIAAGAGAFDFNKPPLKDIELFEGKSVFYSVQSKNDFAGKKILIAGGGDSAVDWAISLSEIAQVSLVHRRNKFRAAVSSVQKLNELANDNKLELITGYQLASLKGLDGKLDEVMLHDLAMNKLGIRTDILLPFFGLSQNLGAILNFGLQIKNHHIEVDCPYFETNIKGVYAVGDVATYRGKLKLILTGFAEVASALHHAYQRVFDKALHFEYSTMKGVNSMVVNKRA